MNKKALRIAGRLIIAFFLFQSVYHRIINFDQQYKNAQQLYEQTSNYFTSRGLNLFPPSSHSKTNIQFSIYLVCLAEAAAGILIFLCQVYGSVILGFLTAFKLLLWINSNTSIFQSLQTANVGMELITQISSIGLKSNAIRQILNFTALLGLSLIMFNQIKTAQRENQKPNGENNQPA